MGDLAPRRKKSVTNMDVEETSPLAPSLPRRKASNPFLTTLGGAALLSCRSVGGVSAPNKSDPGGLATQALNASLQLSRKQMSFTDLEWSKMTL